MRSRWWNCPVQLARPNHWGNRTARVVRRLDDQPQAIRLRGQDAVELGSPEFMSHPFGPPVPGCRCTCRKAALVDAARCRSPRARRALVHDVGIDVDHRTRGLARGQQCLAERRTGNGLAGLDRGQDFPVDTGRRRRIRRSSPESIRHLVPTWAYKECPVFLLCHCCLPSAIGCSHARRCHRHGVRRLRQGRYFTSARKLGVGNAPMSACFSTRFLQMRNGRSGISTMDA